MQIFISWSGEMAKRCAEALRDWLPYMNQAISPFVSSQDISKGERGLNKIADQLQECSFGIVCVTRENQSAPWINFESGALSRELGESSLVPFLLDMQVKDLSSGPITQFQATDGSSKEDVWAMVKSINQKCEKTVDQERLQRTFERFWDDLAGNLTSIREGSPSSGMPQRETSDILDELVKLVREQNMRIGALEKSVGNVSTISSHYTINDPKEVRITGETDESLAYPNRVTRVARMARGVIGPKYVARITRKSGQIDLYCTDGAEESVRQSHGELQELASDYGIAIHIYGTDGTPIASHPPF